MAQAPQFVVEREFISVPQQAGRALVDTLRARGGENALTAAAKIERAMRLHESTTVELAVLEDEEVLAVIPDHGAAQLARLEHALRAKIERENA